MRIGKRDATERQPAWAIRLGHPQDCDCAPWKDPRRGPAPVVVALPGPRRRSIWDLGASLHCSIIGTCLTTDALRRLMRKVKQDEAEASDHRLHGLAVGLCGKQGVPARLINKALDEQHRAAIRRADAAKDMPALRGFWSEAQAVGDIPGAYWAVLTHPLADQTLIADAFGDVHMLSHLVGASNRADIRRLAEQDREIATLKATVAKQQQRLRDDLTERDGRIRALQDMLVADAQTKAAMPVANETDQLIVELQSRLSRATTRVEALEARRATLEQQLREAQERYVALRDEMGSLRHEIDMAEALFEAPEDIRVATAAVGLVLYVGGRSGQTSLLRQAAARAGAELLHHDAEQGLGLLPGLVGRADLVVFPVDCVSHEAALAVKRLCRQLDRPFQPLRSTGAASLLAALRGAGPTAMAAE